MWAPKDDTPESTLAMASSQMPPMESRRLPGLVAAFQKPAPNPDPAVATLVDDSRSAAR
jgi:hypothetical protein